MGHNPEATKEERWIKNRIVKRNLKAISVLFVFAGINIVTTGCLMIPEWHMKLIITGLWIIVVSMFFVFVFGD